MDGSGTGPPCSSSALMLIVGSPRARVGASTHRTIESVERQGRYGALAQVLAVGPITNASDPPGARSAWWRIGTVSGTPLSSTDWTYRFVSETPGAVIVKVPLPSARVACGSRGAPTTYPSVPGIG